MTQVEKSTIFILAFMYILTENIAKIININHWATQSIIFPDELLLSIARACAEIYKKKISINFRLK